MLYLVFCILGFLIGQFALLAYFRAQLGWRGWEIMCEFYDAALAGEVEIVEEDEEEEDENDADHA